MTKETWITAGTAAKILEERFGRPIRVDYVTRLGSLGRLRKQDIGSRIVLYHRHDVEQIQIRERKKPSATDRPTQLDLPITEKVPVPSVEESAIPAISQPTNASICIVERFEDMPPGSMKRAEFAKKYGIHNPELGNWLEYGLKGDRLPVTYYKYHNDKAAAFTPEQQEQVLAILKRHGKLKS